MKKYLNYQVTKDVVIKDLVTIETLEISLGFSYPENVNVPEPEEYRDFSEVVQEIMSSLYSLPVDN